MDGSMQICKQEKICQRIKHICTLKNHCGYFFSVPYAHNLQIYSSETFDTKNSCSKDIVAINIIM